MALIYCTSGAFLVRKSHALHRGMKIPNDRNDWHPRMLMSECINVNFIVISFSAFDTNVLGRNAYVLANQDSISISSDLF